MANLKDNSDNLNNNEDFSNNYIPGGFVLRPRCIKNSKISTATPCARETYELMVREATHQKIQYKGYWLDKGQLLTTQQELINKLQWLKGYTPMYYTKAQMKTAMKILRNLGLIDTKNVLHGTIITICNYEYYQRISNYEKTPENPNETPTNTP